MGSTRGLTDENGTVTDTYLYDAFGNVVGAAGTTANDYRFAGEQWDGTLGQYYLRQRYYDPQSGRFTRRDTYEGRLEEPITLHKYLYANSNPVNGIDPSGLFTLTMGSDIYAIAGILATLTYIQLSQNSPEQLGGFGEGPSPKPPSHTGHRPTESLLQRVLSFPGRNAGPKLEHTETFPTNTWEDFVQHVFNSAITRYARGLPVTYGGNFERKVGKHVEQIRRTTGATIGKKIKTSPESQQQVKDAIENVVKTGEARQIPWGVYDDAIWSRKGDAIVIRQSSGEFVTFLEAGKGGALKWR